MNIQLVYSSELSVHSLTYDRGSELAGHHYEALEINVISEGMYVLWSESEMNTIGYIYQNDFDSLKPSENLLLKHDGHCNNGQLKLMIGLQINIRYVLVVASNRPNTTGNFSIYISGPNNVNLDQWRSNVSNGNMTTSTSTAMPTSSTAGITTNCNALIYMCFVFVYLNDVNKKYIN